MNQPAAPVDDETSSRHRLLLATAEVLGRSGQTKLSLSEVALQAGVSRPTLYRWFASKPVKQYTAEAVEAPLTLRVYPGADGSFELFEDDGTSFAYRAGGWMGLSLTWDDKGRRLSVQLTPGSTMRAPMVRDIVVRVAGTNRTATVTFSGRPATVTL